MRVPGIFFHLWEENAEEGRIFLRPRRNIQPRVEPLGELRRLSWSPTAIPLNLILINLN